MQYYVHVSFKRFEGDKGLQFAKWCDVPLILQNITQGELDEAIDAFEDARSGKHEEAIDEVEAVAAAAAEREEEEAAIAAAQQRARGSPGAPAPAAEAVAAAGESPA